LKPFITYYNTRTDVTSKTLRNTGDRFKDAWELLGK